MFNKALLGKWLRHFVREVDRLWRKLVVAKYGIEWKGWCSREVRSSLGKGL